MSELKNRMKWTCACGASLDTRGQGPFAAGMLQNFVRLHPCSLAYLNESENDDDEEPHSSATDSYHERRGEFDLSSDNRLGQEKGGPVIGFQPNDTPEKQELDND